MNPKPEVLGAMQAGGDLVNVVKQYNEFKLRDKGIKLAVGLMFITDIHSARRRTRSPAPPSPTPGTGTSTSGTGSGPTSSRPETGTRPSFAHAANYSAAMQYLEAVQAAGTDDADAVVKGLEGKKFNDVFLRNGKIRAKDHRVIHDAYLAKVKPQAEVTEPWDYEKILKTIPAAEAFRPRATSTCSMTEPRRPVPGQAAGPPGTTREEDDDAILQNTVHGLVGGASTPCSPSASRSSSACCGW